MDIFPRVNAGALATASGRTSLLLGPFDGVWGRFVGPSIRRAVVQALRDDANINALVGANIYAQYIPQDMAARPAVIVVLVSHVDDDDLPGRSAYPTARFQFQLNARPDAGAESCELLARSLHALFHRVTHRDLPVDGEEPVHVIGAIRDGMEDTYLDADDGGEPVLITRCFYLFTYQDTAANR